MTSAEPAKSDVLISQQTKPSSQTPPSPTPPYSTPSAHIQNETYPNRIRSNTPIHTQTSPSPTTLPPHLLRSISPPHLIPQIRQRIINPFPRPRNPSPSTPTPFLIQLHRKLQNLVLRESIGVRGDVARFIGRF